MRAAAFVIATLFLPTAVAAQEPPIKVGERVRFRTTQSSMLAYGTLTRWEADSFAVADNWIPITSITMRPSGVRGFCIGSLEAVTFTKISSSFNAPIALCEDLQTHAANRTPLRTEDDMIFLRAPQRLKRGHHRRLALKEV